MFEYMNYMNYGPYICIGVVLLILFVLWAFCGGKDYEFVGLAPLAPNTCQSYTGSIYEWGQNPPATQGPINTHNDPPSVCVQEKEPENIVQESTISNDSISNPPFPPPSISIGAKEKSKSINLAEIDISAINLPKPPPVPVGPGVLLKSKRRGKFISHGERICCQTMEKIYGLPFRNTRPDWLINPETGEKLELDCYNEELQIAVEYNGEQHYKWPNFTQQSRDEFFKQVQRDELKVKLCDRRGVYLIVVPYTVPNTQIPEFIMSYLPETIQKRLEEEQTLANIR